MNNFIEKPISKADNGLVCNICGGPNAAIRYGAVCCPSCAAFFARTIRKLGREPYRCPMTLPCSVMYTIKRRCKACRLRKCHDNRMRLPPKSAHVFDYQPNSRNMPVQQNRNGIKQQKANTSCRYGKQRSSSCATEFQEQPRDQGERARERTSRAEQHRVKKYEDMHNSSGDMSRDMEAPDEILLARVDRILTENGHLIKQFLIRKINWDSSLSTGDTNSSANHGLGTLDQKAKPQKVELIVESTPGTPSSEYVTAERHTK